MRRSRGPLVISAVYFTFGFLWILISDEALKLLAPGPEAYQRLQTGKGWIYVGITTVLIYLLLRAYAKRKEGALHELNRQQQVLRDVLEEKEELIRELHHRVKNNLQLVISLTVEKEITMPAKRAVSFGIIFHELAANALYHAYEKQEAGEVVISVYADSSSIILKVEDFGKGFDTESVSGEVGLDIAEAMSSQIEGRLTIASSASGTAATLTVPL
jgi:two-component sensor histidine kinase